MTSTSTSKTAKKANGSKTLAQLRAAKPTIGKPKAKPEAKPDTPPASAEFTAARLAADVQRIKASVGKGDAAIEAQPDPKEAERLADRARRFPTAEVADLKKQGFNDDDANRIITERQKQGGWKRDLSQVGPKPGTPQIEPIKGTTPLGVPEKKKTITIPAGLAEAAPAPKIVTGGALPEEKAKLDEKIAKATEPPAPQEDNVENVEQLQERLERSRQGGGRQVAEPMAPAESITCPVMQLQTALLTAAKQDDRYYLQTVRLHLQGNDVRVVSTDGHKILVMTTQIAQRPAWLTEKGVLFSAADLGAALAVCAKHGETVTISTGVDHPFAQFTSGDQFCSFRVALVDGQFPDYQKIMNGIDLSNAGGDPLAVATLNPAYVRDATAVAKSLGAKGMQTFAGNEQTAATFLFQGSDAVMLVMPLRIEDTTRLLTAKTVAIVGGGLASSVGALRAHLTRTTEKIKTASGAEKKALEEKAADYQDRIDALLRMSREALPAPAKKAAA